MKNEREAITTDPMGTERIIKEYYKQLSGHKFGKLDEMDQFLKDNLLKPMLRKII